MIEDNTDNWGSSVDRERIKRRLHDPEFVKRLQERLSEPIVDWDGKDTAPKPNWEKGLAAFIVVASLVFGAICAVSWAIALCMDL